MVNRIHQLQLTASCLGYIAFLSLPSLLESFVQILWIERSPRFGDLTAAIQVQYCELRTERVGAIVKHAAAVTPEEET